MLPLTQTTGPTIEPVTTAEAKLFLRVTNRVEDDLIDELIQAARIAVETWTLRQLVTATWQLFLDAFPSRIQGLAESRFPGVTAVNVAEIAIPRPPLQVVNSVKYYDLDGNQQTLDAGTYDVDTDSEPGILSLTFGESWPSARRQRKSVEIDFDAGYGDAASDVPANAKIAIKMLVADVYEHREFRQEIKVEQNPAVIDLLGDLRILEVG